MIGSLTIEGKTYPIVEAQLHLSLEGESRWMYLTVNGENGGFGMWDVEFALLQQLDDLDGKRMHTYPNGETYKDDTLGTDITGMYETTDINYLQMNDTNYVFGETQIDFERVKGLKFRCRVATRLTNDCSVDRDSPPEAFPLRMTADFTVTIDERAPGW